jgi:transcriptional regulator with XRE-family HTH domain
MSNFLTTSPTTFDSIVDDKTDAFVLEIVENVHNAMLAANVSRAELARRTHTKPPRITQLLGGHANPTIRTLMGVAVALNQDVHDFFRPRDDRAFLQPIRPVLVFKRQLTADEGGFLPPPELPPVTPRPVAPRPVRRDGEEGGPVAGSAR